MTQTFTTNAVSADSAAADVTVKLPHSPLTEPIGPGTLLVNTYLVEALLGEGGMGEVYLARHISLGTKHAIKVIRSSMARDERIMGLFYREAMVLRGVRHESIVNYDGFVRDDQGRDYLVMEYVEGESLAARLKRGPLSVPEVLILRDRLCSGLAEAHRRGAVHRDISPDNVILQGENVDSAKLIDFGLCKLTAPNQATIIGPAFAGKYRYAAPEQFGLYDMEVDARADIYSLGLILAAAALGYPLDMGNSSREAAQKRRQVPDLSAVPEALRAPLALMLQPNPADRPAGIDELLARWPTSHRIDAAHCIEAPPRRPPIDVHPRSQRRLGVAGAVGALVLLAFSSAILYSFRSPVSGPSVLDTPTPPVATTPEQPSSHIATEPGRPPEIDELIATDRVDAAFALVEARLADHQEVSTETLWTLAKRLHTKGRLDQSFALLRTLARADFGPALFALGEFYDPLYWSATASPLSKPNPDKAREWYQRAADAGVAEAGARLEALR